MQGVVAVPDAARGSSAQAYLAVYENNLSNAVAAGENRGKQLRHDFVVRALAGPFPVDPRGEAVFVHRFRLDAGWKTADLRA